MHDVFSHRDRRAVLYYLQDADGRLGVRELTERVVRRPGDGGRPTVGAYQRIRRHVRAMAEFDLVGHDPESDTAWLRDDVAVTVSPPDGAP